jgi:hypothetical protein
MANVSTVTVITQGFTGAPGYSKFRFDELSSGAMLNAAGAAVRAFMNAVAAFWPSGANIITAQISPIVQHNEIGTGDLTGESTMSTPPTQVNGLGASGGAYAGGTGAVIHWTTGAVSAGRKVRGRTFLVPLLTSVYSSDGTIISSLQTSVTAAGNALIADTSTTFGIYSRFWDKKPGTPPLDVPPHQVGGAFTSANGCVVPDRSAQLRTRRS